MAITYTILTDFEAKDILPVDDPDKIILGADLTTEFESIQAGFAGAAPTASPTFTGTATFAGLTAATVDINGGSMDAVTIGASVAAEGTFTTMTAAAADISSGTIDGTVIGASFPSTGTFTTVATAAFATVTGTLNGSPIATEGYVLAEIGAAELGPISSITQLSDVDTTTSAPASGEYLQWDGANWVPAGVQEYEAIITVSTTSTSKTLTVGERCYVDTSGQTITLPASPSAGDFVSVVVANFDDTVVARNGSTIMDLAEDMTLNAAYASVDFQYIGTTWRLV